MYLTVIGLGRLGRGVGDVIFLAESGAELIVTDLRKPKELQSSLDQIKKFSKIELVFGKHRLEDFRERDLIIKGASVPLDSVYIREARTRHIPVAMSTALFAKQAAAMGVTIIGVTGTRGKSTTTHLLFEILKLATANNHSGQQIFLGGNIRSVATLPFLNQVKTGDIAILELDSWQLQGFNEESISPHLAIFTNFFPDHLNYYRGDLDKYLADKASIFLHQTPDDYLIVGKQAANLIRSRYEARIKSRIIVSGPNEVPADWRLKLPGAHNRYNISLILNASLILEIDQTVTRKAVENFRGVPGRLELVLERDGIKFYNDTTATTPEATMVGLQTVATGKNAILIMGGADKNLDLTALTKKLPAYCKEIILLPGTGTDKFLIEIGKNYRNLRFKKVRDLEEAVGSATTLAQHGDVILLSPAFASFGLFKNEFERGEQFNELIKISRGTRI